ncbi:hypothetical protein GGF31_008738 [Allomyces arbusculus]|nr:hypothetical protein GGF31_008738 [Allomyces arbusculus]
MSTPNLFAAANRRGSASDASSRRPSYLALDSIRNNNSRESASHYSHASKSASVSEPRRGSLHDRLSDLLRRPSAPGSTVASAKQFQSGSGSYDSREALRHEVGQLLLAHRQRLLEVVITANFTREHVTDICNSTLALLRAEKAPRTAEGFVARVMEKKIQRHAAVEMSDVHLKNALRDNSLEILLLSAFIRTEAADFLQALLSHFITENDTALIDLGEDTSRGIQVDVPETPTSPAPDTQTILRALVGKLLERLHAAADMFPPSVRRLCVALKNQMDDLEAKLSPHTLARSRCSSAASTESAPAVPSPLHHAVSTESAPSVPLPLHHRAADDESVGTPLPFPTAEFAATESLRALAIDTLRARSAIASPQPGGSAGLPTCSSHGSTLPMAAGSHGPPSRASSHASLTRQPTLRRTHARRKLRGMVELSVAENIVASCLFLRFLVPALTMPEQYGVTIPAQNRRALLRGLLQCGRLVNTLCNDSDAKLAGGDIQAQHYVFEQRLKVKQTIERVTSLPVSADTSSASDWRRPVLTNGLSSSPPGDSTPSAASTRSTSADSVTTDSPSPPRAAIDPPDDTDANKRSLGKSFMSMLGRSRLQRKKEFRSMPQIHLSGSKEDGTAFSSGPLRAPSTSSSPTGGMSLNSLSDPATAAAAAAARWGVGPSDALMAQMSKGMDRIEEHFHQSAGTFGALHHSLALGLLTLKSNLDKFHALPTCPSPTDDHATSPSAKTLGGKPSAGFLRAFGQRLRFRGSKNGAPGESVDAAQHVVDEDKVATTPRSLAAEAGTPRLAGLAPSAPASCPVLPTIPTVMSAEPVVMAEQQHRARGLAQ